MNITLRIIAAIILAAAFLTTAFAQDIAPAIESRPSASAARPTTAISPTTIDTAQKDADSKTTKKINDALKQDPELSASLKQLTISTNGGIVTISGQVPSETLEDHLITTVADIVGQSNVRVQLEIAGE
ncbi:MAG TPA: BON domain-containing protein [Candidatus Binataceae bacterium]|nr:BON domain-containing protein [Candidatus Binataceae bacterium]